MTFKLARFLVSVSLLILNEGSISGQSTFRNLDFEQATIVPIPGSPCPFDIYASNALSGWTAYIGGAAQTGIIYDTKSLGGGGSLHSR